MTNISNSTFYGVKWDATAIESINNVSKALLNLTELYRSQNIQIDAMVKIEQPRIIDDGKDEEQDGTDTKGGHSDENNDGEINELMDGILSDMQKVLAKLK